MKEIGGYFEIEFSNIKLGDIHPNAIKLNTARNCLEYILLANGYKKIFVPFYTCDVVLEPIIKHDLVCEFYQIDKNFEPLNVPVCQPDEAFLYTNYFGIKEQFAAELAGKTNNLIIDNSQALFAAPVSGADTFYSLRKFAGVADGAFLYSKKQINFEIEKTSSAHRVSHLYERKDTNAAAGYGFFKENDASLSGLPLMKMSASTEAFLQTYDFEKNKTTRERNFLYLHHQLREINEIDLNTANINGPLCYPFLNKNLNMREHLIKKGIYIPTFWSNVLLWIDGQDGVEKTMVNDLLPLPVDHRCTPRDLKFLVESLLSNEIF